MIPFTYTLVTCVDGLNARNKSSQVCELLGECPSLLHLSSEVHGGPTLALLDKAYQRISKYGTASIESGEAEYIQHLQSLDNGVKSETKWIDRTMMILDLNRFLFEIRPGTPVDDKHLGMAAMTGRGELWPWVEIAPSKLALREPFWNINTGYLPDLIGEFKWLAVRFNRRGSCRISHAVYVDGKL